MSMEEEAVRAPATPREEVEQFFASISPDIRTDVPSLPASVVDDTKLTCKLHNYQRQAIAWAVQREKAGCDVHGVRGGVIACEMGLGKTVETLGLILSHPGAHEPNALGGGSSSHDEGPSTWAPTHPLKAGRLERRSAVAGAACGACGRRLFAQEPVHVAADGWNCCQWCLLPHHPALKPVHVAAVEEAAGRAAAPSAPAPPRKRVRFGGSPGSSAADAAFAAAASRRAALDDSRGLVADDERRRQREEEEAARPYVVPPSQRTGLKIRIKRPLGAGDAVLFLLLLLLLLLLAPPRRLGLGRSSRPPPGRVRRHARGHSGEHPATVATGD